MEVAHHHLVVRQRLEGIVVGEGKNPLLSGAGIVGAQIIIDGHVAGLESVRDTRGGRD